MKSKETPPIIYLENAHPGCEWDHAYSSAKATEWEQQQDGARHAAQPPALILHRIDSTARTLAAFIDGEARFHRSCHTGGQKPTVQRVNRRRDGQRALTLCILLILSAERSGEQSSSVKASHKKTWSQKPHWMGLLSGFVRYYSSACSLQFFLTGDL